MITNEYLIYLEITHSKINGSDDFMIKCHKNFFRSTNTSDQSILEHVCYAAKQQDLKDCWFFNGITLLASVVWTILVIKEIIEAYCIGWRYFLMIENWVEIGIILFSAIFFYLSPGRVELAHHPLGWLIFMAWMDLLLYLGRFQIFGEIIYMSFDCAKTMTLCILTYSPSFFAFSFGFYVLLHSNENFSGYVRASINVMSMMVDELNYVDNFDYNSVDEIGGRNVSVQIMFVAFMICMSMIVMNLFLAVTVNKTENLADRSRMIFAQRKIIHLIGARKCFLIFKSCIECFAKVTHRIPLLKRITSVPDSIVDKKVTTAYYLNMNCKKKYWLYRLIFLFLEVLHQKE